MLFTVISLYRCVIALQLNYTLLQYNIHHIMIYCSIIRSKKPVFTGSSTKINKVQFNEFYLKNLGVNLRQQRCL